MFYKNIVLFIFVICFSNLKAQTKNNEWQIGFGAGVTKFSDESAIFIGDKHQFQIPRLNISMPLTDNLAIDGAIAFQTLDFGFITNEANYFSMDASIRYFKGITEQFYPYAFVGVSLAKSSFNLTPTFNIGAGATYWVNEVFGLNAQVYYKHSLDSFESMQSHIQITGGMVFALNIFDLLFNGRRSSGFCSN